MRSSQWSNAQIFLVTEFPWSVTMAWMGSYLSLFLLDQGLSASNLGVMIGLGAVIQLTGLGLSGFLTRRLGRKGTIMFGDFAGWIVVLGLWAIFHNPWILGVGVILNQASGFVGPAWNSLFSEDEHPQRLPRYFLFLQILTVAGGLVLPLTRGFVMHSGVVNAGHLMLWWLWPLVSVVWLIRLIGLKESAAGRLSMGSRKEVPWKERSAHIREGLAGAGFYLALLRVFTQVPFFIVAAFVPLALVSAHGAHLQPADLALLPLGAVGALILLAAIHPLMRSWRSLHRMGLGLALLIAGYATLALAPASGVFTVLGGWGLMVAGQSQFSSSHTSVWMMWLPDRIRVDVQGWIGVVTAGGVAILSPLLAGQFQQHPRVVFGVLAILFFGALLLWNRLRLVPDSRLDSHRQSGEPETL
jgi:MFS family permease